ncbi:zinc finger protein Xfin-like [Hyalella azteca]|uniref:Zinc finger protein Xfin-like n=1 Tax=Hyalella azteca TaxID=294128 RepID=A0A8B7NUA4_HYAAZ|nr:zinc finger protein Xfin-like [Hyalella azteca]
MDNTVSSNLTLHAASKQKKNGNSCLADRMHVCGYCSRAFTRSDKLKMHLRIHTGERPYHCFCSKTFTRQDKFKQHLNIHPLVEILEQKDNIVAPKHDALILKIVRQAQSMVPPCSESSLNNFTKKIEWLKSTAIEAKKRPSSSIKNESLAKQVQLPNKCTQPNASLKVAKVTNSSLHSKLLEMDNMSSTSFVKEIISCEKCDCSFESERAYVSHMKSHSRNEVFKCFCGREFRSLRWLDNHKQREGCLNLKVDSIQVSNSESSGSLSVSSGTSLLSKSDDCCVAEEQSPEEYIRVGESPNAAHITSERDQTFLQHHLQPVAMMKSLQQSLKEINQSEQTLNSNESSNSPLQSDKTVSVLCLNENKIKVKNSVGSDNMIEDDSCEQSLLDLILKLKKQDPELTVSANKKFSCDYCFKTFSKKHKMQIHRRMHTGEKPYCCTLCGKAFSRKDHMIKHMNVHYKYRRQVEPDMESSASVDFVCNDRGVSGDLPVQSALYGVSIMQEQQSELQTKLAALSALAKAFEIQNKERSQACMKSMELSGENLINNHSPCSGFNRNSQEDFGYNNHVNADAKDTNLVLYSNTKIESVSDGKYQCRMCNKSYHKARVFLSHSQLEHKVHGNSKFTCSICEREVWTRRRFEMHVLAHSDSDDESPLIIRRRKKRNESRKSSVADRLSSTSLNFPDTDCKNSSDFKDFDIKNALHCFGGGGGLGPSWNGEILRDLLHRVSFTEQVRLDSIFSGGSPDTLPLETNVTSAHDDFSSLTTDEGSWPADSGSLPADAGSLPADADSLPADADSLPADADSLSTDAGSLPAGADSLPADADSLPADADSLSTDAGSLPADTESDSGPTDGTYAFPADSPSCTSPRDGAVLAATGSSSVNISGSRTTEEDEHIENSNDTIPMSTPFPKAFSIVSCNRNIEQILENHSLLDRLLHEPHVAGDAPECADTLMRVEDYLAILRAPENLATDAKIAAAKDDV